MKLLLVMLIAISFVPVFSQSVITFDVDTSEFAPGQTVEMQGKVETGLAGQLVSIEIKDGGGNVILIRTITTGANGEFTLTFKVPETAEPGEFDIVTNVEIEGDAYSETKSIGSTGEFSVEVDEEIVDELTPILPYLGIAIIAIIVVIIVIIKKSKKSEEEDYDEAEEFEADSIIENSKMTPKFRDMQIDAESASGNNMEPHQIIESKLKMISKLQENKIGDNERLEEIKKSLINSGTFSQSDNNYLEEKYEEYQNLESKDKKKSEDPE